MTKLPSDPLLGYALEGRYVIESRIARGGMAVVYQGVDRRLHRTVAIKVMHAHLAENEDYRVKFESEARNAAKLAHPNLVSVLDQGEDNNIVYLVMEYLPGITLRELLKEQNFLTTNQTLEISQAILQGLTAAHSAGIIHRDLKPENVLLAEDGRIKLGDFGLARAASTNTATGQALLGTIAYLSPELVTRGTADKRSDIYAFGIMLYEMLTGEQPFTGEQPMQVAYRHAHEDVPPPSAKSSESTPLLDQLVSWCTQKNPADRPADGAEVLAALTKGLGNTPNRTTPLPSATGVTTVLPATTTSPQMRAPLERVTQPASQSNLPQSVQKAQKGARRRKRKGFTAFFLVFLLAVAAATGSWWKLFGPGSDVVVPKLVGVSTEQAIRELQEISLTHTLSECPHLEILPGHVVSTTPKAGARVKKETAVELCESTGPEILPAPEIVGSMLQEAEEQIEAARFIFGGIVDEFYSDDPEGTVLAALAEDGTPLPDLLPELSVIKVNVSAGPIPNVAEMWVADAVQELSSVGLVPAEDSFTYSFSDELEAERVINIALLTENPKRGDRVSLHVSKGPELFPVPDVEGMTVREALDTVAAHGFTPKAPWFLNEAALESFQARGTSPKAGSMLQKGAEVEVNAKIL